MGPFLFSNLFRSKHWLGGGTETNGVICYRYQTLGQNWQVAVTDLQQNTCTGQKTW